MKSGLTKRQVAEFDMNGYIVLQNSIPNDLVQRLCNSSNMMVSNVLAQQTFGNQTTGAATVSNNNKTFVIRINDLFSSYDKAFIEVLGCPVIVDAATSLAEDRPISIYESLVVKNLGDGTNIGWHRDMIHKRTSRIFTVGIYLDDANCGEGALRVIPGSHLNTDDICAIQDDWGNGNLESTEINMKRGDILIHDVMLVHSSTPFHGREQRRTIYFEFRSTSHIEANNRFTREWIGLRKKLLNIAENRWHRHNETPHRELVQKETEQAFFDSLYMTKMTIEPGHYCFKPTH